MILSGTGHRPDKLGGYKLPNPTYDKICQNIEHTLLDLKPEKVISGFCIGYDLWLANIAMKLKIPVMAAVPFEGQEKNWPADSQRIYNILLNKASEKVIVCDGGYSAHKMQLRNEFLVDQCDVLLACWNGEKSGGTYNCMNYCTRKFPNKKILIIDPSLT